MGKILIVSIILLALILTACGNSGPATRINFTLTDFAFSPGEVSIAAGQEITLHITHAGSMEHNFIVMKYGTDAGETFDEADRDNVLWEMDLQPGDSKTVLFTAPERPGTYQVICGMPGHVQSGMVGKLIVTEQQQ
jgi:uncharacterized cupredoxin-like copper-binding protein